VTKVSWDRRAGVTGQVTKGWRTRCLAAPSRGSPPEYQRDCVSEQNAKPTRTGPRLHRPGSRPGYGADVEGPPGSTRPVRPREQEDLAGGQRSQHERVGRVLAVWAAADGQS
jgi:hypothetical protein